MTNATLLPCPFCGGNAYPYASEEMSLFCVECRECNIRGAIRANAVNALAAWNNRTHAQPAIDINDLVAEFESMPGGLDQMGKGRQWVRETLIPPVQPVPETEELCKTCGGAKVDPGGLPSCRTCMPQFVQPATAPSLDPFRAALDEYVKARLRGEGKAVWSLLLDAVEHEVGEYTLAQPAKTFVQERAQLEQEWCELQNLKAAYKLPQPVQPAAEPVYQYQLANGHWIDQTRANHDYNVRIKQTVVRVLYAASTKETT